MKVKIPINIIDPFIIIYEGYYVPALLNPTINGLP